MQIFECYRYRFGSSGHICALELKAPSAPRPMEQESKRGSTLRLAEVGFDRSDSANLHLLPLHRRLLKQLPNLLLDRFQTHRPEELTPFHIMETGHTPNETLQLVYVKCLDLPANHLNNSACPMEIFEEYAPLIRPQAIPATVQERAWIDSG